MISITLAVFEAEHCRSFEVEGVGLAAATSEHQIGRSELILQRIPICIPDQAYFAT